MFWNKKKEESKKEEPKEIPVDPDLDFIKETLNNLNLLNISNLVDLAMITSSKKQKEEFKRIMKLLEPEIIKLVKEGETYGEVPCSIEDYKSFPRVLMGKTGSLTGLYINCSPTRVRDNEDILYLYTFRLNKPSKDD